MAGIKGRSGGRCPGAGAKKKADLEPLHGLMDGHVGDAVWASLIGALVERARQGDVHAFRELRLCRFGHIPMATERVEDERPPIRWIVAMQPCSRKHVEKKAPI